MYYYFLHHLNVSSEFNLFLDEATSKSSDSSDIKIVEDKKLIIPLTFKKNKFNILSNLNKTLVYQQDLFYAEISENGYLVRLKKLSTGINSLNIARRILNIVLPFCLYQKQRLVFHASAISIEKKGILFLGNSGAGKSTLAASFQNEKFISEDIVSMEIRNNEVHIIPSFPYIKLSSKAALSTGLRKNKSIYLKNDRLKRSYYNVNNFENEPIPLTKCLNLSWGDNFSCKVIEKSDILKYCLASNIGALPLPGCSESSRIFMKFFEIIAAKVDFFDVIRAKNSEVSKDTKIDLLVY